MLLASNEIIIGASISIVLFLAILVSILVIIFRNPFNYPYYAIRIDVSGKRNPQIEDVIDKYLIEGYFSELERENEKIKKWTEESFESTKHGILKKIRRKQLLRVLDEDHAFIFRLVRAQTRYKQRNYVKSSYIVYQTVYQFQCNFDFLKERNDNLASIDYECTLNEYFSNSQRRLMTKDLRQAIMKRDNYTCQCCGKYMPDEVGLHIDHILPISKGGKSIPSNLQVLCSKCNGKKSNSL